MALSYVWVDLTTYHARKEDFIEPSTKYNDKLSSDAYLQLKTDLLEMTIVDALVLVKSLRERYLWVDQLCIIQNDEVEKLRTISYMDRKYKAATLTVVAAEGANLASGLAGVKPYSRKLSPVISTIDGIEMLCEELHISIMDDKSPMAQSPWNSRAWTYQEYILS